MERETKEEARRTDHQKVDRDADHDLVGAEANGRHAIEQGERHPARGGAEQSDPRTPTVVTRERAAKRAAQHVALETERDETRALRDDATTRREEIRDRDAQ